MNSDTAMSDVQRERERRGWSVREAAVNSGLVSNETWRRYESGGPLTGKMRRAVAQAFGWSTDWPDRQPPVPHEVVSRIGELEALLREVQQVQLTAIPGGTAILEDLQERVSRLELRVGRLSDDLAR